MPSVEGLEQVLSCGRDVQPRTKAPSEASPMRPTIIRRRLATPRFENIRFAGLPRTKRRDPWAGIRELVSQPVKGGGNRQQTEEEGSMNSPPRLGRMPEHGACSCRAAKEGLQADMLRSSESAVARLPGVGHTSGKGKE
jgi:hypothetical protein